ncbi:BTB/POZ domain-containing protein [Glomus cerebriforme]|uniref:BTB/POZ domain-containing protein n=1 Tax=Glomus cerebriforme TaxID=658196 RepID=A0A397SBB0_9GLOM|nr:BTB/POZ domain-containing protein [Glomus cerebriforme]
MSYTLESDVIKAFKELLKTEANYDIIIRIRKNNDYKEFHAHSIILSCRSEYFKNIFSAKDIEKKDGKYIIEKQNITPQAFDIILKYLYTGHININNKTGAEVLDILITSDELNLNQLTKVTEDFIIENHQQFLQNDPVGILLIIYCYKSLVNLQELCLETICFNPTLLFNSDKFIELPVPLLEIILKRDHLNLIEIKIWENLIKWGLAQERSLNRDVSKWNQEDFNNFQRILYKFIPLIRFYEISSEDYANKVKPYEKILPKELKDDIFKFHMIPGYKPTLNTWISKFSRYYSDSVLINQKHITIFANWIDKKEGNSKYINNIPYKFNLLYRASRDGFTSVAFHNKCNYKGATIVIIKIKDSEQIIGGYNALELEKDIYRSTMNNFIFSFKDRRRTNTAKVGYRKYDTCYLIDKNCGPVFDGHFYCSISWIINNEYLNSYPNIGLPIGTNINIDDYEVFQRSFFDSVLINKAQNHLALFASWIDKEEVNFGTSIPYKFNLLYRASRDGFTITEFHNKCDNKGPTIMIIKITGSKQIIGGYNPFEWDSVGDYYKTTTDIYGPVFGGYFYCDYDGTAWTIQKEYLISFPKIGLPTGLEISVDDYEVFQVAKSECVKAKAIINKEKKNLF